MLGTLSRIFNAWAEPDTVHTAHQPPALLKLTIKVWSRRRAITLQSKMKLTWSVKRQQGYPPQSWLSGTWQKYSSSTVTVWFSILPGCRFLHLSSLVSRVPTPVGLKWKIKSNWIHDVPLPRVAWTTINYSRFSKIPVTLCTVHLTCWYIDLMFLSNSLNNHSLSVELSIACLAKMGQKLTKTTQFRKSLLFCLQAELDPILVENGEGRQGLKGVLLTFSRLHFSPPEHHFHFHFHF